MPRSVRLRSDNPLLTPPEKYGLPRIIGGETAEPRKFLQYFSYSKIKDYTLRFVVLVYTLHHTHILQYFHPISDAYPWQISLQLRQLGIYSHICGGSVVDETTIVCASHCVVGQVASAMQVINGKISLIR